MARKTISSAELHSHDVPARAAVDPVVLDELITCGAPPHVVYAYRKTGVIVTDQNSSATSLEDRARWDAALKEFATIEWEAIHKPRQ